MRDFVLLAHLILGTALVIFSILLLPRLKVKDPYRKLLSILSVLSVWIMLGMAAVLYVIFYPVTKTLVKAGSWPWAHSILMETKEHWGLLLPIIVTMAAGITFSKKPEKSRRWWILVIVVSILLAIMGRLIKMGAIA